MNKSLKFLMILLVFLLLSGCASIFGNANYSYTKKANGDLRIFVDSGRTLKKGFDVQIKPNGEVSLKAGSAEQGVSGVEQIKLDVLQYLFPPK